MRKGGWNPARVLAALGKIGYDPVSAVLDIADNSVSHGAEHIDVSILVTKRSEGRGCSKAIVDTIVIKDDGRGMNEELLDNALSLGSSEKYYSLGTLSKFGLGLKSAASSLGKRLEIITRMSEEQPLKAILDQEIIEQENDYVYDIDTPNDAELEEFDRFVGGSEHTGTFIKISKINCESLPSVAEILDGLRKKIGIVYYYYITGQSGATKRTFTVNGEIVEPYDPLFTDEIDDEDGNLDELNWDGLSPKWITRQQDIQLDTNSGCIAKVEITQLPHPPSVADREIMSQKACRDKYMIGAGNYGFYIYRNMRLISWADSLEMVGQDQNLYSFRGRILIDSDSDEVLNIDVTKSRIQLSELAKSQLTPIVQEAKNKSFDAWDTAKRYLAIKTGQQEPHSAINEELDKIGSIVEKDDRIDEEVASADEQKKLRKRREQAIQSSEATPEEKEKLVQSSQRVQYVEALPNNQLWQRAHDPESGLIVRVNRSHRLIREILESQTRNSQLVKVLDVLFFSLARGEYSLVYKSDHDSAIVERIIADYREYVGNDLSEIIRKLDISSLIDDVK